MALQGDATNDRYLVHDVVREWPGAANALSLFCWVRQTAPGQSGVLWGTGNPTNDHSVRLELTAGAARLRPYGTPTTMATTGAALAANQWVPLLGVLHYVGATPIAVLFQGDAVYSSTGSGNSGWTSFRAAPLRYANFYPNVAAPGTAFHIAECAMWAGALGAADWAMLRSGVSPADVRGDLCPLHFPLRSDWSTGAGLPTETLREQVGYAQVWTDHPPVQEPRRAPLVFAPSIPLVLPRRPFIFMH